MLDIKRFCQAQASLEQTFPLSGMLRLQESCHQQLEACEAKLALRGEMDMQGLCVLRGELTVHLPVQCQRCMKSMSYEISSSFVLSPVSDDVEAKNLPSGYEPLYHEEGKVDLSTVVEDEILLNIPASPMHDLDNCQVHAQDWHFGDESEVSEEKSNPFQVLADLKKRSK